MPLERGTQPLTSWERALLGEGSGPGALWHVPANPHICLIWLYSLTSCWHWIRRGRWECWGRGKGERITHSCSRKGQREEAGRNEAERGPEAGRGRKPTAVVVGIGISHPLQQVKALSQQRGMWCGLCRHPGPGPGLGEVSGALSHCPLWPIHCPTSSEPVQTSKPATILLPSFSYKIKPFVFYLRQFFFFVFPSSRRLTFSKLLRSSQPSREKAGKNQPAHFTEAPGSVSNIPEVTWLSQWKNNLGKCWLFHLITICSAKICSGPQLLPRAKRLSCCMVNVRGRAIFLRHPSVKSYLSTSSLLTIFSTPCAGNHAGSLK